MYEACILAARFARWYYGRVVMPAKVRLRRWLVPRYRFGIRDVQIETWGKWRAWAGIVIVTVANLAWQHIDAQWMSAEIDSKANAYFMTVVVAAMMLVLPSGLLVALAGRGRRRAMFGHVAFPLRVLLASAAGAVAWYASCYALAHLPVHPGSGAAQGVLVFVVAVPAIVLMTWLVAALWYGLPLLARYYFRAADGHPALPALVSLCMAAWAAGVGIVACVHGASHLRYPFAATVGVTFGGPITVTGLALWELRRLRTRWGITLRWLPPPAQSARRLRKYAMSSA